MRQGGLINVAGRVGKSLASECPADAAGDSAPVTRVASRPPEGTLQCRPVTRRRADLGTRRHSHWNRTRRGRRCRPRFRSSLESISFVAESDWNDRGGARTLDQRINVPHRLSPTTVNRPAGVSDVESLDYPIAVAGVPRLVSGTEADDPPAPRLLMTQSLAFFDPHARRYRPRCGVEGSQGVPAICGIHSSRFGFFPREAPSCFRFLKSVALPTELPGPLTLLESKHSRPPRPDNSAIFWHAKHLAQRLVRHRHDRLAPHVVAEIRLDHADRGFHVGPPVVVVQVILAVQAVGVVHLLEDPAHAPRRDALEGDVGPPALTTASKLSVLRYALSAGTSSMMKLRVVCRTKPGMSAKSAASLSRITTPAPNVNGKVVCRLSVGRDATKKPTAHPEG